MTYRPILFLLCTQRHLNLGDLQPFHAALRVRTFEGKDLVGRGKHNDNIRAWHKQMLTCKK